ncbi:MULTISPECIES: malonate decarboxylase acyl carrier protein [unclassified Rhizobium]|uniref:malonate decarboxylase acyl carrier protein n=1 Tax=unclassified Rhizobium TaxID=2613769 RepID=UPI000EA979E7|nr:MULTISPECIES: malonate decarboxylase acyl carrier protein [unclassified Rhizobium]AYG69285.1 malonate decarboxylase acyl carrier protein [Rhizobium sp. CCGE531]AYG75664.1 malonate decarboxylase acyl carrier protein [Rhizobium sp. CCGE532]NLR84815.1 malonate decarboxylase acyl carrier protein [Rhizobium sp. P28RR-XV]NLS16278.1 malonate decarboxylase acyl carrier protein [Rhizobium sp. P40RR-XXII]
MENLLYELKSTQTGGTRAVALVGVVASGNLEILLERREAPDRCVIEIATPAHGFSELWAAVTEDFAARSAAGGLRITINDGGARPDMVALRLAQGVRLMEKPE